ncbi:hypothetical protein EVJ58_g9020 [Rhodofomes roseus]|uniref:Uncharacterized protein n=1 Tax=Rhodofomes roseus TaxID=34475 RepID=A0A4Y9XXK4_9APHY|nr:hypothetical protein EVJ58_g9020 [Rhodofomes roseus]
MPYEQPLIDERNPFYCPALDALAFLQSLRHELHAAPPPYSHSPGDHQLPSFAECLDKSLDEAELHELLYRAVPRVLDSPGVSQTSLSFSGFVCDHSTPVPRRGFHLQDAPPGVKAKRKRPASPPGTFSDLLAPPKREKSYQSVNEGSFELSARGEKLRYFSGSVDALYSPYAPRNYGYSDADTFELERRIRVLEDELYGPPVGAETPRSMNALTTRLDTLLPGIRLKERLQALKADSHQHIANILAVDGHLNAHVLEILRMSEIDCLDLTASLMDAEGLNLGAKELLPVFSKPNSFLFLSELSLSDASLQDFDMTYIHHLPRLSRLWLSNTGISNEAVSHLVALRRTLSELDIALNAAIDDDVISALLALPKLSYLSVFDTGVRMPGLRRLAKCVADRSDSDAHYTFELEVPRECEEYLDSLHRRYMLHPAPPLIAHPAACTDLSVPALRRNLAAHAAF